MINISKVTAGHYYERREADEAARRTIGFIGRA
jgi:hypothetical protein